MPVWAVPGSRGCWSANHQNQVTARLLSLDLLEVRQTLLFTGLVFSAELTR
jgi:hypothetical protein